MSDLQKMIDAGVHFGHQTKFWNPKMKEYIFGSRNKIHIINLDKTVVLFKDALKFAEQTVKNKGTILFVGTRSQAGEIIAEEAKRAGQPYVDHRWLGGMLTNFDTVKKSIKKLETKKALLEKASEHSLSKKEVLDITREVAKLEATIGGICEMKDTPSALFIVDTGFHDIAIKEAKKLGIPVIGVVDTNNDPTVVDYVIPGNDDSQKSIRLYAEAFADVIIKAREASVNEIISQAKVEVVEDAVADKPKTVRKVKKAEATVEVVENKETKEAAAVEAKEEKKPAKKVATKKVAETSESDKVAKKPRAKKAADESTEA